MTMIPMASALNSDCVMDAYSIRSSKLFAGMDFEELHEKYVDNPSEPTPILITLLIWLLKVLRLGLIIFYGLAVIVIVIIRRITNNTAMC